MNPILDIKTQFYHLPVKTDLPKTRIAQAFHQFKEAAKEENVRTGTLKTVKAALQLHEVLLGADHKDIRAGIGFAVDTVKVFNIPITIAKIIQDRKSKLKTLVNTLDLLTGVFAGLKVLDYFKAIDLGIVARALGHIPVIGKEVAKVLPFSNIVSIVDIVRSSFSIHQSRKEIKTEKKKKIKHASKRDEWEQIRKDGKITHAFVEKKLASSIEKKVAALDEKTAAEEKMTEALKKYTKRVAKHENLLKDLENCSPSAKFRLKRASYRAFGRAKRARNEYEKALGHFQTQAKKWAKYEERVTNWTEFENMIPKVNQPVQSVKKLSELKISKWDRKTLKSDKTIRDSKISIGINTASIVVMVASMVLTILALSALPFVSIPLTIAFIALAAIGMGFFIWKKVRDDITYKAVPISMLWENQGAIPLPAQA
jgi:hypothetical protein